MTYLDERKAGAGDTGRTLRPRDRGRYGLRWRTSSPADSSYRHVWAYRSAVGKTLAHATVLVAVAASLLPLAAMVATSLQSSATSTGVTLWPLDPTLDGYQMAWSVLGFGKMFRNSTLLALSTAVLCTSIAAMAAYGLARYRIPGRKPLIFTLIVLIAIPPITVIVPVFVTMSGLGWVNAYPSAVITQVGVLTPFATFLLYSFMKELPTELYEAASVDGASHSRQFFSIALPLSRPAVATTALVVGIFSWNDLLIPLLMWPNSEWQSLMVGLATLAPGRTGAGDIPLMMSGVAISVIPLFIAYVVARRSLISGLVEGIGKG